MRSCAGPRYLPRPPAGTQRLLGLLALGDVHHHRDAFLPVPCGQHDSANDDLIGVARIDAETNVRLSRRVRGRAYFLLS